MFRGAGAQEISLALSAIQRFTSGSRNKTTLRRSRSEQRQKNRRVCLRTPHIGHRTGLHDTGFRNRGRNKSLSCNVDRTAVFRGRHARMQAEKAAQRRLVGKAGAPRHGLYVEPRVPEQGLDLDNDVVGNHLMGGLFVNNTRRKSVITGTGTNSNMRMTTSFILKTLEKTFLWMKLA